MTEISIELVPRTPQCLDAQLHYLSQCLANFTRVNIPDLTRMTTRSWQGCAQARHYVDLAVPHLRAIDFDKDNLTPLVNYLDQNNLSEVLVVRGDPPVDDAWITYPTSSCQLIYALKALRPNLIVYAALDPYRMDHDDEINYCHEKLLAGCDGFFTQPFFDLALMESYQESLRNLTDKPIFWGVSPVVGPSSQRYWENINKITFPEDFSCDLPWNKAFAKDALAWVKERQEDIYFMPVRVELDEYLNGVLY